MMTWDARYHDVDEGWIRVDAAPRSYAEQIVDMSYIDGWLYYLSYRHNKQDTLWVTNLAGSLELYPHPMDLRSHAGLTIRAGYPRPHVVLRARPRLHSFLLY